MLSIPVVSNPYGLDVYQNQNNNLAVHFNKDHNHTKLINLIRF